MAASTKVLCWFLGTAIANGLSADEGRCSAASLEEGTCVAEVTDLNARGRDHAMLATRKAKTELTLGCTGPNVDPFQSGSHVACCDGTKETLGQWNNDGRYFYKCIGDAVTEPDLSTDTVITDEPEAPTTTAAPAPAPSTVGKASTFRALEWNVWYQNSDYDLMASKLMDQKPTPAIIGLCEFTQDMTTMAKKMSEKAGFPCTSSDDSKCKYRAQPNRNGWLGYGTDMFYDADRYEALGGGHVKTAASQCGSQGGDRAVNWVVLREWDSGNLVIAGGTHLSYCSCSDSCRNLQWCELQAMFKQFEPLKQKYPNAAFVWMGDLNRANDAEGWDNTCGSMLDSVMNGNFNGYTAPFKSEDISKSSSNTHMNGGKPIDFVFGELGKFTTLPGEHGNVVTGLSTGTRYGGSDHYPVASTVTMQPNSR